MSSRVNEHQVGGGKGFGWGDVGWGGVDWLNGFRKDKCKVGGERTFPPSFLYEGVGGGGCKAGVGWGGVGSMNAR